MRAHITWLLFQIKRGWLYLQGLMHFGPGPTHRGGKAVHLALDAFENFYDRLPTRSGAGATRAQTLLVRATAPACPHTGRTHADRAATGTSLTSTSIPHSPLFGRLPCAWVP